MKYSKVKNLSKIGNYYNIFNVLWGLLSKDVIEKNTSKTLARIIDALYTQNEILYQR